MLQAEYLSPVTLFNLTCSVKLNNPHYVKDGLEQTPMVHHVFHFLGLTGTKAASIYSFCESTIINTLKLEGAKFSQILRLSDNCFAEFKSADILYSLKHTRDNIERIYVYKTSKVKVNNVNSSILLIVPINVISINFNTARQIKY